MRDTGKMTYKMAVELKLGQMGLNMMEITKKEKNMDMASIFGMMGHLMKEIGLIIKFVVEEYIVGQMAEYRLVLISRNMRVIG
jgi:hypothetical protein